MYKPEISPRDVVVFEVEFESIQEYDEFWSSVDVVRAVEFHKQWDELIARDHSNEIWTLVE